MTHYQPKVNLAQPGHKNNIAIAHRGRTHRLPIAGRLHPLQGQTAHREHDSPTEGKHHPPRVETNSMPTEGKILPTLGKHASLLSGPNKEYIIYNTNTLNINPAPRGLTLTPPRTINAAHIIAYAWHAERSAEKVET